LTSGGNGQRALFQAIPHQRISELVSEKILELIRAGELKAGDRLPSEHELVRQLGVGRTSVREALQRLKAVGVVTVERGRGAFVSQLSAADAHADFLRWSVVHQFAAQDLMESRMALEQMAAAAAAVRGTAEQIAAIENFHISHLSAAERGDLAAVIEADTAFHQAILTASDNPMLERQCAMVTPELVEFREQAYQIPGAPQRASEYHGAIVEAIKLRDSGAARAAMIDHMFWIYQMVDEVVAENSPSEPRHRMVPRAGLG
jgi:GntR family transcriptional regulator, transcriptional repressor for pyruvate dehydrogenase complex